MTIDEKDITRYKEHLSTKFRSGYKWLAFTWHKYSNDLNKIDDLKCFKTLNEASLYSQSSESKRLKPIATLLGEIKGEGEYSKSIDEIKLRKQIAQYPIESFIAGRHLSMDLWSGKLKPLRTRMYRDSKHIRDGDKPDVMLIGKIKNEEVLFNKENRLDENTGVLFTYAYSDYLNEKTRIYKVDYLRPPDKPVIKQTMLAKCDVHSSKLEFYDGELQKVEPGESIDHINLDSFSFEPVRIINTEKKTIAGDEKLNGEKHLKLSNRLKNG